MITIKEMAEMLGISTTTVSNVINGKNQRSFSGKLLRKFRNFWTNMITSQI